MKKENLKEERIHQLKIEGAESLLKALERMNSHFGKLLIVVEKDKFIGLISIGDIQRYFIEHQNFNAKIKSIIRKKSIVAYNTDLEEDIRNTMLKHRIEFMPILNQNKDLEDVIFWDDLFDSKQIPGQQDLKIPVVIMAGGKGSRLKPITNIIPKPLIPIGEQPIVEVIIDRFVKMGASDFYLTVNYKANMIKEYFNSLKEKEYSMEYFHEDKPLGTAGSLHLLKDKITDTFFVSNCDIIIDQDYKDMYEYHKENENELTLIAAVKQLKIPYGTVDVKENGLLSKFEEKPEFTFLVNAGLYILEPHLLKEIPQDTFYHITHLIEKIKERGGRIGVFPVNGSSWMDIGEWKYYQQTLRRFDQKIEL